MKILDVTEILKSKFIGRKIRHNTAGVEMFDGQTRTWTDASGTWTSVYEIAYGDLEFVNLEIIYDKMQLSDIPKEIVKRRWILENFTDFPDKKNLTLQLTFTESVNASTSTTITQGRTATFKADANFNIGVFGKASVGYSETISLSTQNNVSKSVTKTNSKVENYDFGYEIPSKTAAIIDLTKELVTYQMPFTAKMTIDGYFYIIGTYLHNGVSNRQPIDKGWGKISDYLNEEERTLLINGLIGEIVGETTRRSTRFEPLKDEIDNIVNFANLMTPINLNILNDKKNMETANIQLTSINAFDNGSFDVTFSIDTGLCSNSSCATFDATLIFEIDGDEVMELYSFEGWTVADSGSSYFSITRMGNKVGLLKDVVNIESPEIICDDEI